MARLTPATRIQEGRRRMCMADTIGAAARVRWAMPERCLSDARALGSVKVGPGHSRHGRAQACGRNRGSSGNRGRRRSADGRWRRARRPRRASRTARRLSPRGGSGSATGGSRRSGWVDRLATRLGVSVATLRSAPCRTSARPPPSADRHADLVGALAHRSRPQPGAGARRARGRSHAASPRPRRRSPTRSRASSGSTRRRSAPPSTRCRTPAVTAAACPAPAVSARRSPRSSASTSPGCATRSERSTAPARPPRRRAGHRDRAERRCRPGPRHPRPFRAGEQARREARRDAFAAALAHELGMPAPTSARRCRRCRGATSASTAPTTTHDPGGRRSPPDATRRPDHGFQPTAGSPRAARRRRQPRLSHVVA